MSLTKREELERLLAHKRRGGALHAPFVSASTWLGGLAGERDHEPFVALGPKDWEEESELAFFRDHEEVERFIERLRETARQAWGPKR